MIGLICGLRAAVIFSGRRRTSRKAVSEPLEERRLLSTIVVNTTSDDINPLDGTTSLREAMKAAETNPAADLIKFSIPTTDPGYNGQWWTITLNPALNSADGGGLPVMYDDSTTIDGTTQAGYGAAGVVGTGGTVGVDQVPLPQYPKPTIAISANQGNAFDIDNGASRRLDDWKHPRD